MLNVLLIGSGGREHALALSLSNSPVLKKLYAAPGNPGIAQHAECTALDISLHNAVIEFCKDKTIDLVVIGPEIPLVAGLVDSLEHAGIKAFGPTRAAAQLEGSKSYTKALCAEFGIPTASYQHFQNKDEAWSYAAKHGAPLVVKADGLAAGKGVIVAMTLDEARSAIDHCFETQGASIVIEDYLEGEEVSFFLLSDGRSILPLTSAQDHKRVGEGDTGPNTGGMGAYSPAPIFTPQIQDEVIKRIIEPTIKAMQTRETPYKGVLYAGLMLTKSGPQLIEYNCRFGDPETQAVLPRLDSDLLELMLSCVEETLQDKTITWRKEYAMTVVLAAQGYPGTVEKGSVIKNLAQAEQCEGVTIFHAGTEIKSGELVANAGRVLNVTALGSSLMEAQQRAYDAIDRIDWPAGFCRRDIGWRALQPKSKCA